MKFLFVLLCIITLNTKLFATWSIIVIDSTTKEIGIAGASCTKNCYGIGDIVPGKGAIIVQAMSNNQARTKGMQMILTDHSPAEIISALQDPLFDPMRQQYAVVTLKHFLQPATYSGDSTNFFKGARTGPGISVQGNTLMNDQVLEKIFAAALQGQQDKLPIDRILMLALEAGAAAGGDKRCGEQRATSAFVVVAKAGNRKPYLNLVIFGQARGGQNAVAMLRNKYERWSKKHSNRT
jgi:uncharacterized Ntn-hydrolase superfamily protein